MLCEICGDRPAKVKIKIGIATLNACEQCSGAGDIISMPKPRERKPQLNKPLETEYIVVEDYANRIKAARQAANLTQEDFARELEIGLSAYRAAEAGKRLDLKVAKKIENKLKIKLIQELN